MKSVIFTAVLGLALCAVGCDEAELRTPDLEAVDETIAETTDSATEAVTETVVEPSKDAAEALKDSASEAAESAVQTAEKGLEEAKGKADEVGKAVGDAVDIGREKTAEALEATAEAIKPEK